MWLQVRELKVTKITLHWLTHLAFFLFLVLVNILSGLVAITFDYPSLFDVQPSFGEYAVPLPFTWALAHWPSMLLYGGPLLYLSRKGEKFTRYYRLFCVISFGLLMLEMDEKIPFLLFPKVDAVTGLIFSLVLVPPRRAANPFLFFGTCAAGIATFSITAIFAYGYWQHRAPSVRISDYAGGVFLLTSIEVDKQLHEIRFAIDLKERLDPESLCFQGSQVGESVISDYPFDPSYNRFIEILFNPSNSDLPENNYRPYRLGEISLNESDRDSDGTLACSLRYKL